LVVADERQDPMQPQPLQHDGMVRDHERQPFTVADAVQVVTLVGTASLLGAAATACHTCGTEPREGARFCDGCGAPITERDGHAEYKQVTVLFADVVHSMDIAAAVGAERLREIMTDLIDRASAVVQRYGGTVDKFTGDGIMAVFTAIDLRHLTAREARLTHGIPLV
jgi:class 3 adenylate cyclase